MIRNPSEFARNRYDLLVIGGGINGAAIAHVAARRGLKVALLEKGDFASGTSSKSTKLIHGGIRYLENLEMDLVYESLHERREQLQAAPHLVRPLAFVIPVYKGDKRPLCIMRFGVFLYDLIAGSCRIQPHKNLTADEVLNLEPGLKKEGLTGGVIYYDAQMDDARLCLENVLSAAEAGAHVANYVQVRSFLKENGRVTGVKARDLINNEAFEVRARKIVCAAGPWTNELLRLDDPRAKKKIRTTKGIHIVYRDQISRHALLIASQSDKRIFFVIPWMGRSLIGTTDTDYISSPDQVKAEKEDIDYLLHEARRVLPGLELRESKITSVFAGLRPLIRKGGSPIKVSRKHLFYDSPSGITFVVGGKYTTYRKIAADFVNRIRKPSTREVFRLYGGGVIHGQPAQAAKQYGVSADVVQSLMNRYGSRWEDVLKLTDKEPELKEIISENPPVIKAELVYAVQTEMALTAEDILMRRLSLSLIGAVSEKCFQAVKEVTARQT